MFTFGGANSAHYTGNFSCAPVINRKNGLWLIKVDGVNVGNETDSLFCRNGCEVSVDSGCSYVIIGPPNEVELLHKKLGGTYAPNITNYVSGDIINNLKPFCCIRKMHLQQYVFPCSARESLPKIVFKIAGKDYPLSGMEYVQRVRIISNIFTVHLIFILYSRLIQTRLFV